MVEVEIDRAENGMGVIGGRITRETGCFGLIRKSNAVSSVTCKIVQNILRYKGD